MVARRFPSIGVRPREFNFSDSRLQQLAVIDPEKEQEIEDMLVEQALLPTTEQQQQQQQMPVPTGPSQHQPSMTVATQTPAARELLMQLSVLLLEALRRQG